MGVSEKTELTESGSDTFLCALGPCRGGGCGVPPTLSLPFCPRPAVEAERDRHGSPGTPAAWLGVALRTEELMLSSRGAGGLSVPRQQQQRHGSARSRVTLLWLRSRTAVKRGSGDGTVLSAACEQLRMLEAQTQRGGQLPPSTPDSKPKDVASKSVGLFFMLLIDLTAIVGNAAVMTVIVKTPALRKFVFVFHLCLVDFLAALTLMPLEMLSGSAVFDSPVFGEAMCRVYLFLSVCFISMCILSISTINVERYYYVVHPMRYEVRMTVGLVACVLVGVWLKAVATSLVPVPRPPAGARRPRLLLTMEPRSLLQVLHCLLRCLLLPPAPPHHRGGLLQHVQGGAGGRHAPGSPPHLDGDAAAPFRVAQQPFHHGHHLGRPAHHPAEDVRGWQGGCHLAGRGRPVPLLLVALLLLPPLHRPERPAPGGAGGRDRGHLAGLLLLHLQPFLLRVPQPADPGRAGTAPHVFLQAAARGGPAAAQPGGLHRGELPPVPPRHRLSRRVPAPHPQPQAGPAPRGFSHPGTDRGGRGRGDGAARGGRGLRAHGHLSQSGAV
ncbi:G protein-coupled receptor 61, partial [Columba livia]